MIKYWRLIVKGFPLASDLLISTCIFTVVYSIIKSEGMKYFIIIPASMISIPYMIKRSRILHYLCIGIFVYIALHYLIVYETELLLIAFIIYCVGLFTIIGPLSEVLLKKEVNKAVLKR